MTSSNDNNNNDNNKEKKRKRGYAAFSDYLKKTEKTCKQINQLDDWSQKLKLADEIVQDIPGLLEEFGELLSKQVEKKLKEMLGFSNIYTKAPLASCAKLISRIKDALDELQIDIISDTTIDKSGKVTTNYSTASTSVTATGTGMSPKIIAIIIAAVVLVGSGAAAAFFVFPSDQSNENNLQIQKIDKAPQLLLPGSNQFLTDSTPFFEWSSVFHPTGVSYTLKIFKQGDTSPLYVINDIAENKYILDKSLPLGNYVWQVIPVDGNSNMGPISQSFKFNIVEKEKPPEPEMPVFSSKPNPISPPNNDVVTSAKPIFRWQAVSSGTDGIKYTVSLYTANGQPVSKSPQLTSTQWRPSDNYPDGTYKWQVTARNNQGEESISDMFRFTINTRLDVPTLTSPQYDETTSDRTPTFDWTDVSDPSGGGVTYTIQIFEGRNLVASQSDLKSSRWTSTAPLDDGTYFWNIIAKNSRGLESQTTSDRFTVSTSLSPPILMSPINNRVFGAETTSVSFRWSPQSSEDDSRIDHYFLQVYNKDDGRGVFGGNVYSTSYSNMELQSGNKYAWQVRAVDKFGNSGPFSNPFSFTINAPYVPPTRPGITSPDITYPDAPSDTTPPPAPTLISPKLREEFSVNTSISFNWNPVSDASGIKNYEIEIDGKIYPIKPTTSKFEFSFDKQGSHNWRVRAVDGAENKGKFSEMESVIIKEWNVGRITWGQTMHAYTERGQIMVTDPDMSDSITVHVWSGSDPTGIDISLKEVRETGRFVGFVSFTPTDESSGITLRVSSRGDTVTAAYTDNTLPAHTNRDIMEITAKTTIYGPAS